MNNDVATNEHKNSRYVDGDASQTGAPHCPQLKPNKQTSFLRGLPVRTENCVSRFLRDDKGLLRSREKGKFPWMVNIRQAFSLIALGASRTTR